MAGDIGQRLVAHDAAARDVLVLGFALAPCGERLQPAQHRWIAPGRADTLPCDLGIVGVVFRIGQLFHLCIEPCTAAGLDQLFQDAGEDLRQMRHVADGIFDLAFGQRATAPVSKARTFVDRQAEPALDQIGITDLLRLADRHHRDLCIEDRLRGFSSEVVDDLDVLPAGMEDLEHFVIVAQQFP